MNDKYITYLILKNGQGYKLKVLKNVEGLISNPEFEAIKKYKSIKKHYKGKKKIPKSKFPDAVFEATFILDGNGIREKSRIYLNDIIEKLNKGEKIPFKIPYAVRTAYYSLN